MAGGETVLLPDALVERQQQSDRADHKHGHDDECERVAALAAVGIFGREVCHDCLIPGVIRNMKKPDSLLATN